MPLWTSKTYWSWTATKVRWIPTAVTSSSSTTTTTTTTAVTTTMQNGVSGKSSKTEGRCPRCSYSTMTTECTCGTGTGTTDRMNRKKRTWGNRTTRYVSLLPRSPMIYYSVACVLYTYSSRTAPPIYLDFTPFLFHPHPRNP